MKKKIMGLMVIITIAVVAVYSIYTSHEKLGDELSIQCSMLTHTNRQLSLPVHLHLVPVNVFKGIHLLILLYIYTHSLSRKLF